ncbi:MAG: hypothetical protein MRK01_09755 [Candidatus Scalindua sp.]|nr:hypothetical protein [Candidatus Scalindua sp.]
MIKKLHPLWKNHYHYSNAYDALHCHAFPIQAWLETGQGIDNSAMPDIRSKTIIR